MNYKTFIFAFCLSLAAVQASTPADLQATADNQALQNTQQAVQAQQDVVNQKMPKHIEPLIAAYEKLSPKQKEKKRRNAIRMVEHSSELLKSLVQILEKTEVDELPNALDTFLESKKDSYDVERITNLAEEIKRILKEDPTGAKNIVEDIAKDLEGRAKGEDEFANILKSESYVPVLSTISDDLIEDFVKKHPEPVVNTQDADKKDPEQPFYTQTWFLGSVGGVLVVAIAATVFLMMRNKNAEDDEVSKV